jgi:3-deoxy-D-manno-octulosonic-acid transferase
LFLEVGAARTVVDATELANEVSRLLEDPTERHRMGEIGRQTLDQNRGALQRLLDLIDPLARQ